MKLLMCMKKRFNILKQYLICSLWLKIIPANNWKCFCNQATSFILSFYIFGLIDSLIVDYSQLNRKFIKLHRHTPNILINELSVVDCKQLFSRVVLWDELQQTAPRLSRFTRTRSWSVVGGQGFCVYFLGQLISKCVASICVFCSSGIRRITDEQVPIEVTCYGSSTRATGFGSS